MGEWVLNGLGALNLAVWIFMLLFWGQFWRANQRLRPVSPPPAWPEIAGLIPARDEADSIGRVVQAHLASAYRGKFTLIVVDDSSSDGTGDLARAAGLGQPHSLLVVDGAPLAQGWTGKLWAQAQGLAKAREAAPDARYFLLCDADIAFGPGTLGALVAKAEAEDLALVSLMARLDARGPFASLLIPAFVFFFQKLYPFAWANDPARKCAAAAGGVMLIRAEAVEKLDLPASISGALIDDCSLAAKVKASGRRIWLGLSEPGAAISLRDNRAMGSIWSMVARTAYAQLGHSPVLLAGSLLGLCFLYLTGPILLVSGALHGQIPALWFGASAWALMSLAFFPTALDYRRPWIAPLLPLAGLIYGAMTFDSARRYWQGQGGAWKGRTYPAALS